MNMISSVLGSLMNKEQAIQDTIQDALEKVAAELNCSYKDLFLMIRPIDSEFNHSYFVCKYNENGMPVKVREISIKEILGEG